MSTKSPITYELFDFLTDLQINNQRPWFAENKQRYQDQVLDPAVELCEQLHDPLLRIAPKLVVNPKRHRGSVMRIYRDTRFSKDKRPFKTNLGISIRHKDANEIHAPGIYLHLEPRDCFLGCGCWKPDRQSLTQIRRSIIAQPTSWKRTINQIRSGGIFEISGDSLKRAPRDIDGNHPHIEDLKRTDFILISKFTEQECVHPDFIEQVIDQIQNAKPWMRFLCKAMNLPY